MYISRYIFKTIPYGTRVFHNRHRRYNFFPFFLSFSRIVLFETHGIFLIFPQLKNKTFPYLPRIEINTRNTRSFPKYFDISKILLQNSISDFYLSKKTSIILFLQNVIFKLSKKNKITKEYFEPNQL